MSLTVIGTAFVGVLYAALTETLLSAKFQLLRTRPGIPQKEHLVIVGLGKVGQRVANYLKEVKQTQVGISVNPDFDRTRLPDIPLIIGNVKESFGKANLSTAKSIIVTTDNEMLNLEIALMARLINPNSRLVIGAYRQGLSERLTHLLKNAQVISSYAVAAEAFAGAAFGENILNLFRQQATVNSLQRIEQGDILLTSRCWGVRIYSVPNQDAAFEGANAIARISGCDLSLARNLMKSCPQTLPMPFDQHQAQYLIRALNQILIKAELLII